MDTIDLQTEYEKATHEVEVAEYRRDDAIANLDEAMESLAAATKTRKALRRLLLDRGADVPRRARKDI